MINGNLALKLDNIKSEIMKQFKTVGVIILVAVLVCILRAVILTQIAIVVRCDNIINPAWLNNKFWGVILDMFIMEFVGLLLCGIGVGIYCIKYSPRKAYILGIKIIGLSCIFYFFTLLFVGLPPRVNVLIAQVILFTCGVLGLFLGRKIAIIFRKTVKFLHLTKGML